MFENADVKPHGRFFLEEMSQVMAALNPGKLLIGGQPLGTSGRDEESREFARAFLALPAGTYDDIPKLDDPVCGRSLSTPQGTFVYLQNRVDSEARVTFEVPAESKWLDLSSGESLSAAEGKWTVVLKPFELRSFKTATDARRTKAVDVQVGGDLGSRLAGGAGQTAEAVKALVSAGADAEEYEKCLKSLRQALADKRYAEAHRLLFSKLFREIPIRTEEAKLGYLKTQKEMIASGRFAVKCGYNAFLQSSDGRLFFPDKRYTPGSYGYVGGRNAGKHAVGWLKTDVKELFATQAFDVEGYAFSVPNKSYTVKLYTNIGYAPDRKPGAVVMTLEIQGKRVWDNMDVFKALNGDASHVLISEFKNVKVTDGVLRLDWLPTNNRLGWVNAIEVIPE
jgi:hypothetical protein